MSPIVLQWYWINSALPRLTCVIEYFFFNNSMTYIYIYIYIFNSWYNVYVIYLTSIIHYSSIRVLSSESVLCIRWPKYWSFSFSISPSNEYSGIISFRMDWLDLLAVQGTLKSLRQHHSSKASILWHSAFFTVQLLHPYMTTGKTITLTRRTYVGKVMSLLFNMLSRLAITFLPRSKCLLISWFHVLCTTIETNKTKILYTYSWSLRKVFYESILNCSIQNI